ncbi:DNA binding domain protein, excisionase family [Desulfofarcimen acetoxidans DSM 771]|uniref:DNA binding domain protein, excisionase family n=1 Tax=Desulfofarcimen acetoxidans (strain ATCC 49208 / DSM 771 / KCTC 5769 / VKM B-1644 / 5575) TaxID=485916 RepID=C8VYF4_DESAS|nr:IS607 family transposase [Desulfofarcimen acetoxidans]ACV62835.1 DNA binding domain protein, excisionase family [Desulfofarcimen acetoxidans DSM 771]
MDKLLTVNQVAKLLNVWPETVRRWDNTGQLTSVRTPGGHRRYRESQVLALLGTPETIGAQLRCAVYARVANQEYADNGSLQRQKERLITYAVEKDYRVAAVYTEISSGLKENREELAKLLKQAIKGEVDIVLTENKDRLAGLGYNYLREFLLSYKVKIEFIELNEKSENQDELLEDLIYIITSFSSRIYGKRGNRVAKKITDIIKEEILLVK